MMCLIEKKSEDYTLITVKQSTTSNQQFTKQFSHLTIQPLRITTMRIFAGCVAKV